MRLVRVFAASLAIVGMSSSGFAGDLFESAVKAANEQEQVSTGPTHIPREFLIPGAALFVTGLSMAVYGFLHTSGGDFVSGQVSKESNTALGGAGLALAGAGGAILLLGAHHSKAAPSVSVGRRGVTVAKRLTW